MFSDKELQGTKDHIERKMDDVLNDDRGSDLDYIKNIQTLITLGNACDTKLQPPQDPFK